MFQILISNGWTETPPARGGVRRQFEKKVENAQLRVEQRDKSLYFWVSGDDDLVFAIQKPDEYASALKAIVDMQEDLADDQRMEILSTLSEVCSPAVVCIEQSDIEYYTRLPKGGDALEDYFRDVMDGSAPRKDDDPTTFSAGLSDMGSPSVWTGLRLATAGNKSKPRIEYSIDYRQYPDPTRPKAKVTYQLWRYNGIEPTPTVPPPSQQVIDSISPMAKMGYSVEEWKALASQAAKKIGGQWEQLLSLMAHGCPPPPGYDVFNWVQRLQIASALTLAHVDQGWEGSIRKRVLFDLALGPVDWTVSAAIVALGSIGREEQETHGDIQKLFWYLRRQSPRRGFTTHDMALAMVWLTRLGGLSPKEEDELRSWGRRYWDQDTEDAPTFGGLDVGAYGELVARREQLRARNATPTEMTALMGEYDATESSLAAWDKAMAGSRTLAQDVTIEKAHALLRLRMQELDPVSDEARQLMGEDPVQSAQVQAALQAQAQVARSPGDDSDPVVFPGQRLARLSDYVGLMRMLQTGNMQGALSKYGLDMMSYAQVMAAWGPKLASDPVLNAKLAKMMTGG